MAYMIEKRDGYTTYHVDGDKYETGMDERCPVCGEHLDGYSNLDFVDGVIQVVCNCPSCGKTLTFNYWLHNIIAE